MEFSGCFVDSKTLTRTSGHSSGPSASTLLILLHPFFLSIANFYRAKIQICSHRPNSTAAFCRALVGAKCWQIGVNQRLWLVDSSGLCQATLHRLKRSAFLQKSHQTSLCWRPPALSWTEKMGLQLLRFYQEFSQNWRSDQELLLPPAKTFSGDISKQEPAGRVPSPGLGHENLQEEVKSVAGDWNLQPWARNDLTDWLILIILCFIDVFHEIRNFFQSVDPGCRPWWNLERWKVLLSSESLLSAERCWPRTPSLQPLWSAISDKKKSGRGMLEWETKAKLHMCTNLWLQRRADESLVTRLETECEWVPTSGAGQKMHPIQKDRWMEFGAINCRTFAI